MPMPEGVNGAGLIVKGEDFKTSGDSDDWQARAKYWETRFRQLKVYTESLFPNGEKPGRIVMLYWDGKTWLRLDIASTPEFKKAAKEDLIEITAEVRDNLGLSLAQGKFVTNGLPPNYKSVTWKDRYENLEALVREVEGRRYDDPRVQELFQMVKGRTKPDSPIERTRRNNVVQ